MLILSKCRSASYSLIWFAVEKERGTCWDVDIACQWIAARIFVGRVPKPHDWPASCLCDCQATSGPNQVPGRCQPKLQSCHRSSTCRGLLCVLALSSGRLEGVSSRRGAFFYLSILNSPLLFPHYLEWINFRIPAPLMLSLFIAMQKEATIRLHWEDFSPTGDTRYCTS